MYMHYNNYGRWTDGPMDGRIQWGYKCLSLCLSPNIDT